MITAVSPPFVAPQNWALTGDFNEGFRHWLAAIRVVPVVRAACAEDALAVSEALIAGGIAAIEVTLTVPDATRAIAALVDRLAVTVGAGSVRTRDDAERAMDAGARFIVAPTCESEVLHACQRRQVPCVLGALTPTEIERAHAAGAAVVKVFPVGSMGGPSYIKAVSAPLPDIPLMATGGVALSEIEAYLDAGAMAVGIGSELANVAAVQRGHGDEVIRAAQDLRSRLLGSKSR
ncbi:MAG: bifunctional 4-hydroxy-2-oxoglutarate aldolase/2-dehydro-3-deoxy-phosphogluconate aldolase [Deltaproteobacteria bacterium]|nr:bifunctional 4-hydroxy-2-oxoglutarate aldolase/2-dehydro-3-deoxy-phosphogluconate aldolase [Deltaproteobacteria bacterium]